MCGAIDIGGGGLGGGGPPIDIPEGNDGGPRFIGGGIIAPRGGGGIPSGCPGGGGGGINGMGKAPGFSNDGGASANSW
jgi:hypothetical protein